MTYLPCEIYVRNLLPAIRAALATILVNEYKVSLYSVAKLLGVTPASITNYMHGRRGKKDLVNEMLSNESTRRILDEIAKKVYNNEEITPFDYCNLCIILRNLIKQ